MTMAAPPGASTYSYRRTTYGDSSPPRSRASARNSPTKAGSSRSRSLRYFTATAVPVASWTASTTRPLPPEPSSRTCV